MYTEGGRELIESVWSETLKELGISDVKAAVSATDLSTR